METPSGTSSIAASPPSRAWYGASIAAFLETLPETVAGVLLTNSTQEVVTQQRDAWIGQVEILRTVLHGLEGSLFLEFSIPRMGRRIDAVVIVGPVVFAIELKVGEQTFDGAAREQVWDYALDLKNFHEASHAAPIVPILVATEAVTSSPPILHGDADGVYRPMLVGRGGLRSAMELAITHIGGPPVDLAGWPLAPYRPTPTIIEAARALYAQHSVEAIARHDAGARNLRITSRRLDELVDAAMTNRQKIICFVTGVPGAGKTLVGLNVATRHRRELEQPTHAVFLSGNGPLVAVLREALKRDERVRRKEQYAATRDSLTRSEQRLWRAVLRLQLKDDLNQRIASFIQNVHHFRDDGIKDPTGPPSEHVVIFDEAQRAWNLRKTAIFMKERGVAGFNFSEPEFLISYMDRHADWAVIVCLVGGGQEINTGEAGIDAWLDAVETKFPHWHMHISPRLTDREYAAGQALERARTLANAHFDETLHLSVSMRSFRSENVSAFVKALLDCELTEARASFAKLAARYPIVLTRDLCRAKQWVRTQARGSERFGLVASSKAQRLKPHAIDIRVNVDPVHWFLSERDDTRSSYYLEDAATEFQVQGLELDWTCVSWDGDLRFDGSGWRYHDFRGSRWCNIANADNRNYLRNAYRVLLTRARQGMVIFVPPGDTSDGTRLPEYYDATFDYLREIGIPVVE